MEMVMKKLITLGRATLVTKTKYLKVDSTQADDGLRDFIVNPNGAICSNTQFQSQPPDGNCL
jgi:hypothetical protein